MNSKADASNDNAVLDSLTELALNLDWSWSHAADDLWRQLDPELWALTHNPWVILQTVSSEKLQSVTSTPQFQRCPRSNSGNEVKARRSGELVSAFLAGSSAQPHCIFQHGVHAERRVARLFRRAR